MNAKQQKILSQLSEEDIKKLAELAELGYTSVDHEIDEEIGAERSEGIYNVIQELRK